MMRFVWGFALLLTVLLAGNTLTYLNFDPQFSFLRLKQEAIATGWYLPFYYSHVLVGGIILVAGLLQLHPWSLQKFRPVHRALGYVYVMGILFFAAPGGLVMSFFIHRGPWVEISFVLQCTLWFAFTALAFDRIRKKDVAAHRRWMLRSYALTFAAVTLRLYIFASSSRFNLNQPEAYATIAWLSWVPNLLVAEFYIRRAVTSALPR
ncbi:DUF2306 domain-containing protein [Chryseolinea lacunae]|uniref:DUF2306 domain-containing protein n=1 Tax=Chryseolinea lacunae TaxID=2801331 RepID=A0ABS1KU12_9BACT|nr:DUF2306 domain-containing protein [Chryseolinea lacunae]MBL0742920.1 DUF2306 domain-containing protein [Chryseolinea lacunae]